MLLGPTATAGSGYFQMNGTLNVSLLVDNRKQSYLWAPLGPLISFDAERLIYAFHKPLWDTMSHSGPSLSNQTTLPLSLLLIAVVPSLVLQYIIQTQRTSPYSRQALVPYVTDNPNELEPLGVYGKTRPNGSIVQRYIDVQEVWFTDIDEVPAHTALTSKRPDRGFDLIDVEDLLNETTGALDRKRLKNRLQHELEVKSCGDGIRRVAIVSDVVQRDTTGGHKAVNMAHIDFIPPSDNITPDDSMYSVVNAFGGWPHFSRLAADVIENPRNVLNEYILEDAFNIWAPVDEVVTAHPLAFLDKSTFERAPQTRMCFNPFAPPDHDDNNSTSTATLSSSSRVAVFQGITHHAKNRWFYRQHMKRGEAWRFDSFNAVHSAIEDLSDPHEDRRRSCEVRVVILASAQATPDIIIK